MANQPPAGRWMRMATLRPMSNPTQDPPSPPPPAPRPVLGRTFTAVPFRPAVATVLPPVAALPPAPVIAPSRQVTPNLPAVTAIRPAASTNRIPPQGFPNTTSESNGVPSPKPAPSTTAATNSLPSPQRAPDEVPPTNAVPSPQRVPTAALINGAQSQQSSLPADKMANNNYPQPAPPVDFSSVPSPQKSQIAPTANPAQQTSPIIAGNGAKRLFSPRVNSPPATLTSTITTSPISKAPYTPQIHMPESPSQQSPQQPSVGYHSPAASPSPQKQAANPTNFTSTTSAPAPRAVTFSNVQSFSSPTKSPVSPATSTPKIPSPDTNIPADRTPPQSPETTSMAPPLSPLHLPQPQLRSDSKHSPEIPQEAEQKTILFNHTSEKQKPSSITSPNQSPKIYKQENNTKSTTKHTLSQHNKHPETNTTGQSIITIAGENRGALMNLSRPHTTNSNPNPLFPGNPHKLTSPNSKLNGTESDQSSGSNGSKPKSKPNDAISSMMKSFTNSNVQGINNSIMFNSTVTHQNPGVHVAFSRKHKGHSELIRHYKEHNEGHQS